MKNKKVLGILFIFASIFMLTACSNKTETKETSTKSVATKVSKQKKSKSTTSSKKVKESSASESSASSGEESSTSVTTESRISTAEESSMVAATESPAAASVATPVPANPAPVESKVLGVPFISQGSTMLCEGASLLEALHYKGVTGQGLLQFVNSMPRSGSNNPYEGYAGEWQQNVDGTYQGMMAGPVVQWAASVGGHATQISGSAAIKAAIRNNNPVVAWIVYNFGAPEYHAMPWGNAVWNGHVVCVDGFEATRYHIVDPNAGSYWVAASTFENSNSVTGMAVEVG